jgi:hypothetical protein
MRRHAAGGDAAPAGVATQATHPGGAGAPPGGNTASRQELADSPRREAGRKRGPALKKHRDGAP